MYWSEVVEVAGSASHERDDVVGAVGSGSATDGAVWEALKDYCAVGSVLLG